jgi:tetratricopeptide (TPR) repeat protein
MIRLLTFLLIVAVTTTVHARSTVGYQGSDFSGRSCPQPSSGYGPFDYTQRHDYSKELRLVEGSHFTSEIEALIKGRTSTTPYGDIAYTLKAWPNHHRALNSIARYNSRLKRQNKKLPIAAECWFQRAIKFNPTDATIYMLYAIYLQNSKMLTQADTNYQIALRLDPDNIQTHYNYGLLLVAQKKFSEAKKHAEIAYGKAYPLLGLRNKLADAGYWPKK